METQKLSEGIPPIELDRLVGQVEQLDKAVRALEQYKAAVSDLAEEEATRLINETSIKVSRALSPLWTEASKYDQDPYGYYLIGKPIPRLYVPIVQMKELAAGDPDFNLWMTQFTRERNRVSDMIANAVE